MVIVLAIISSMIGLSLAKIGQAGMSATASNTIAMQASNIASSDAALLHAVNYEDLTASNRSAVSGTAFQHETLLSNESSYTDTIKQKIATINVYKGDESIPRSTLQVTRYSVEKQSSGSSVPAGSIIPWYGNLANIPDGFALCDGKNGTPDLRDRFLVGAGNAYKLGDIGGENRHALTIDELPAHNHDAQNAIGYFRSRSNTFYNTWSSASVNASKSKTLGSAAASGVFSVVENGLRSEGNADANRTEFIVKFDGSKMVKSQGLNHSHENRPPYYALYYIMKLS